MSNGADKIAHQAVVVIVGFSVLLVALLILYWLGTPSPSFRESEHKDLFELASYLFPCGAAICAGAGLFIKFPSWLAANAQVKSGLSGTHSKENTSGSKKGKKGASVGAAARSDDAMKAFFMLSLLFLFLGLIAYSLFHPCRYPAIIIIVLCFCWTICAVLRLRSATKSGVMQKGRWLKHHFLDVMVLILLVVSVYVAYGWSSLFLLGKCFG